MFEDTQKSSRLDFESWDQSPGAGSTSTSPSCKRARSQDRKCWRCSWAVLVTKPIKCITIASVKQIQQAHIPPKLETQLDNVGIQRVQLCFDGFVKRPRHRCLGVTADTIALPCPAELGFDESITRSWAKLGDNLHNLPPVQQGDSVKI